MFCQEIKKNALDPAAKMWAASKKIPKKQKPRLMLSLLNRITSRIFITEQFSGQEIHI